MHEPRHPIIISLADDLTGANINASLLSEVGVDPVQVLQRHQVSGDLPAGQALVINVESRDVDEDTAIRWLSEVVTTVQRALGTETLLWNKRIDSTLRGHISAELAFLTTALSPRGTIVAPAFPSAGRSTLNGQQMMGERSVGDIAKLLGGAGMASTVIPARQTRGPVFPPMEADQVAGAGDEIGAGDDDRRTPRELLDAVIVDAGTDEDLGLLARNTLREWLGGALTVDSGPYLAGLARHGLTEKVWPGSTLAPVLLVLGTRAELTHEQLEYVRESESGPVEVATTTQDLDMCAARSARVLALVSGDHARNIDSELEQMSRMAGRVLEESPKPHTILVSGGRTASTFMARMGVKSLELHGELLPLIPVGRLRGGPLDGSVIATKGGLVGTSDTLSKAIKLLRLMRRS